MGHSYHGTRGTGRFLPQGGVARRKARPYKPAISHVRVGPDRVFRSPRPVSLKGITRTSGQPVKENDHMALPEFSMRGLLESGAHFGHRQQRWNPKMAPYIYGERNDIHILDLTQTVPLLHQALVSLREVAASGGRILFVGTKRQASEPIAAAAKRCAQYYVNHRWLGGTLTNWQTISNSIKRMRNIEETLSSAQSSGLKKKELLGLLRERDKLDRSLGGIKEMGGLPNMLFVIDTNKEAIAISEAKKLGIPVTAILDSNCNPDGIAHPIPGNDDAARALVLYCDLAARAIIDGLSQGQVDAGIDTGAAEVLPELTPAADAAAVEVSA